MLTALRRGLLVLLAILPLFTQAAASPHQVIQQTTDKLLADPTLDPHAEAQAFCDSYQG